MYLRYCDVIDAVQSDRLDEVFTPDCVAQRRRRDEGQALLGVGGTRTN